MELQQFQELQHRAEKAEKLYKQIQLTLDQLKLSEKSTSNENAVPLSYSDTVKILNSLIGVRDRINENNKEMENFKALVPTLKQELLEIRKQLYVDNLKTAPEEFRKSLENYLLQIREELTKDSQIKSQHSNKDYLKSIITELESIRQQYFNEVETFKSTTIEKLLKLRKEAEIIDNNNEELNKNLKKCEKDYHSVVKENESYKNGKISLKLQQQLTSRLKSLKEDIFRIENENKTLKMNSVHDPLLDLQYNLSISVVDMHVGGEPLRIVVNGIPSLQGNSLLEKRQDLMKNHDHIRKFLILEPRGHFDMYGVIICEPDNKSEADFGVIFMHNSGYSTMCGHAVLGLGRYAIDFGLVKIDNNNNNAVVRIQCPCGIVTVNADIKNGKTTGKSTFISSPSWAEKISQTIQLEQYGKIEFDIGYGGTYYAIVPVTRFKLDIRTSPLDELVHIATNISDAIKKKYKFNNPDSPDLEFLYGTILTDGETGKSSINVTIFGNKQVDRCPTGSGIMARLAVDYSKDLIKLGEMQEYISKTGSIFSGKILKEIEYKNQKKCIIAEISGESYYCGNSTFFLESHDELGQGFLLK